MKDEIEKIHMRNIMYSKPYRKRPIQTKIYTKFPSKPTKKTKNLFEMSIEKSKKLVKSTFENNRMKHEIENK